MSQGDKPSTSAQLQEQIFPTTPENPNLHRILVTKCSSSPPRSRSQSAGSAHKEALLFFERHQLFKEEEDNPALSGASSPLGGSETERKRRHEDEEKRLIRKKSLRGRSQSQPSQILLCTSTGGTTSITTCTTTGLGSGDIGLSSSEQRQEKKCSSWLEQIQFTAQYQHYRTNDYSSVVNSAYSLDKAGRGSGQIAGLLSGAGGGTTSTTLKPPISSTPPTRRTAPPPLCFHFPKVRVKLPRIFNAKSLDDILGTNKSSSTRSNNKSQQQKLVSSTTSSCTSPHPHNLEIDLDSNSSVGITTPGITNTTGGTNVTEGFTTTSGYFSDLDRRESCDLLVVDQEDFGDEGERRRRHSSLVSYCEIKVGTKSGDNRDARGSIISSTTLPPIPLDRVTSPAITPKEAGSTRSRKWSGSSLQKTTSNLTSAFLLRIPPFSSSSDNKSPQYSKQKQSKFNKNPSKSQSSGSLNRVSVVSCANPTNGISARAKEPCSATTSNPIAKQITKSDNYLNRIVTSTSARFFSVGGGKSSATTAECSSTGRNSKGIKTKGNKKENSNKENNSRSSISGASVTSDFSSTTSDQPPSTQRKWTTVKHKWDLKLQLPPNEIDSDSTSSQQPEESQRLLFIKSQIGQLVEAQAKQRQASLDYGASQSPKSEVHVRPHEAGRVSFRLEPEEIPDTCILKGSSSFNSTSNSSQIASPSGGELYRGDDYSEDGDEMTKSQQHHHFHYAPTKCQGRNRNVNQPVVVADNAPSGSTKSTSNNKSKEKVHLVVANVSYLQRPISPCRPPGHTTTPTTPSTAASSPGVFSLLPSGPASSGDSTIKCTKSSKSIATRGNINEARLIGDNINNVGGVGCGLSCLSYNRDDVLSPVVNKLNEKEDKKWSGGEGAKKSLYGQDEDYCAGNKKSDTLISAGSDTKRRSLQNQNQFGATTTRSDVDSSDSSALTRFHPEFQEEHDADKMGDLQSPTYVKRTAHMFNSIYSSQNGSPPVVDHNPSYLNVSKSVSGYSCLSYNGNSVTNGITTVTNGSSAPKNRISSNGASSTSAPPYSHRFVQNGAGKPATASSNRSEFRIKVNQNQDQVRSGSPNSRDLALSPTRKGSKLLTKDIDEDVSDSNYVPSHGKSFIMQRIERLYGSDAHTVTASTGIATRKTVNQSGVGGTVTTIKFETVHHHQPSRGKETIIPIQLEKENRPEVDPSIKTCIQSSIVSKDREEISQISSSAGYERCFRGDEILIRDQNDDDTHTNIINIKQEESKESELSSEMKSILNHKSFGGLGSVTSLEPCPGKHKLETITLDEKDRHLLISGSDSNCRANGDQPLLAPVEENTGSSSSSIIATDKQPVPLTKTKVSMADLKDGNYFLQEMRNTVTELQRLCDKATPELETLDQQSDRAGNILAAVGKSNLLIKKKFKQFEELCNANLRGVTSDEPATTNDDLAGFWDMVMIQVEQVFNLFKDIEENNSGDTLDVKPKTTSSPKKTAPRAPSTRPTASKSQISAAAKARDESRRKMLAERRRQLKEQDEGTKAQEDVVIFTPENN